MPPILPGDSPMTVPTSAGRAGAHRARGPDVPRHHLDRLGFQLAGQRNTCSSELPPLTLRGGTGVIGAALLAMPRRLSRPEPARAARDVAAAGAGGHAQCRRLDGADGAGAALAARQRGRADRLHHAGLGLDPGLADARRAAEPVARDFAGDGVRGAVPPSWAATALRRAWQNCRESSWRSAARSALRVGTVLAKQLPLNLPPITAAAWQIGIGCLPVAIVGPRHREDAICAALSDTRLVAAGLCDPWSSSASPMSLVCGAGAAAGLGGGDRHHGGAGDRRGDFGARAARAARPRPDRGAGVHAGRRRAGDAVLGPCLHGIGDAPSPEAGRDFH